MFFSTVIQNGVKNLDACSDGKDILFYKKAGYLL